MATSTWNTMTEKQKRRHLDANIKRRANRANWTPEQKARYRDRAKVRRAERMSAMTEEQKREYLNQQTVQRNKRNVSDRKYKRNGKGYFFCWANAIKSRAHLKGIPYGLDADFLQSIMPTHCPILGVELVRSVGKRPGPFSPTVDRIFPEKGYVKDNVMIISKRANQIKSDASPEEVMKVALYWTALHAGLQDI